MDQFTISRIEGNQRRRLEISELRKFAELYELKMDELTAAPTPEELERLTIPVRKTRDPNK